MNGMADRLLEVMSERPYLTVKEAEKMGFSKSLLSKYAGEGLIDRVRQGVYTLPGEIADDIFLMAAASGNLRVSHISALFLHGLSERTPSVPTFTLPQGKNPPRSIAKRCQCFYVKPELFDLGVAELTTTFGNRVSGYDIERTLCDLVRGRRRCDSEVVSAAVRAYFGGGNRDIAKLGEYARRLNVFDEIMRYVEVMQ